METTSAPDAYDFPREYDQLLAFEEEKRSEKDKILALARKIQSEEEVKDLESTFDRVLARTAHAGTMLGHSPGAITDADGNELLYDYEMLLIYEDMMRIYKSGFLLVARRVGFAETDELEADLDAILARYARARRTMEEIMEKEGLTAEA